MVVSAARPQQNKSQAPGHYGAQMFGIMYCKKFEKPIIEHLLIKNLFAAINN